MPNQTVKNGLKPKKIKLPQMNFFIKKKLIKFSCTYQPLSFCKIFKKILRVDPELWGCAVFEPQNGPLFLNNFFLAKTVIVTFICLLAHFIVQNLKRRIPSYEDAPFLGPEWSICPKHFFSLRIINIILIYVLASFIVQNLKKILPTDPELRGCAIFGPKMAHFLR